MATKYIQLGDTLVERARVAGARYVPADSPAAVEKSQNCIRLELKHPSQVISVHPIAPDSLETLWQEVTDHLNGVEPEAASATEADPEPASTAANEEPSAEAEPSPEASVDDEAETEAAAEALPQ